MTSERPDPRAAAALLAWLAFLIATIIGLHALGGALAPPPLTEPGGLNGWAQARQPAEAAFALLRLVALASAWYLLLATIASALARLSHVPAAIRAADMLALPAVRRLVNAAAGISVAASLTTGATMVSTGADRLHYPAMEALAVQTGTGPGTVSTTTQTGPPSGSGGAGVGVGEPADHHLDHEMTELPTLRRLPDGEDKPPPPTGTPPEPGAPATSTPAPPTSSSTSSALTAPPDPDPVQWQVQPGQHFWSVAENVLASAWQRAPSDAEIDPYWRHLVEINRQILRDPANPDLLFPGQVLTVPPPPTAPSPAKPQSR